MKCTALMFALLLGFGGVTLHDSAYGQKKDPKKGASAAGTVTISTSPKDKKYRFQVRTADNEYIVGSNAYKTEKEARESIEELKKILATAKDTVEKPDTKDK